MWAPFAILFPVSLPGVNLHWFNRRWESLELYCYSIQWTWWSTRLPVNKGESDERRIGHYLSQTWGNFNKHAVSVSRTFALTGSTMRQLNSTAWETVCWVLRDDLFGANELLALGASALPPYWSSLRHNRRCILNWTQKKRLHWIKHGSMPQAGSRWEMTC